MCLEFINTPFRGNILFRQTQWKHCSEALSKKPPHSQSYFSRKTHQTLLISSPFQHLREVTQLTRIHLSLANLIFSPLSRVISKTKPPPGTSLSILPQTHLCPRRDASAQFTTLGRTASRVIRGLCIRGRFTRTPPLNGGLACVHHGNIV